MMGFVCLYRIIIYWLLKNHESTNPHSRLCRDVFILGTFNLCTFSAWAKSIGLDLILLQFRGIISFVLLPRLEIYTVLQFVKFKNDDVYFHLLQTGF